MKLDRLQEYVTITTTMIVAILLAIVCGRAAGTGNVVTLGKIFGCVGIMSLCLWLRERIWLLIPICGGLSGELTFLPIHFSVHDIVIMLTFGTFISLVAFKIVRDRPVRDFLDLLLMINLLYLGSVYVRNPTGTSTFGMAKVGGRPYVEVLIAVLGYWVLSRCKVAPGFARRMPLLFLCSGMINTFFGYITFHIPALAPVIAKVYTGVSAETYGKTDDNSIGSDAVASARPTFFMEFGAVVSNMLYAYTRPLNLVNPLYFWRFALFMISIYVTLLSGFRNAIALMVVYFCIASYIRKGLHEVIRVAIFVLPLFVLIVLGQGNLYSLPFNVQRALSFLPGNWLYEAKEAGRSSTEWRVEMWKEYFYGNKYIHNKLLGDGFGFSTEDWARMQNKELKEQESQLITGSVHGGPMSAVRFVGYLGLALYVILLGYTAVYAFRLIRRAQGTDYFPLALYVCLPYTFELFNYLFIFGNFDSHLPSTIIGIGMMKMVAHTLNTYVPKTAPEEPQPVIKRRPLPYRQPLPA